jgi:hypothetical protein
MTEKSLAPTPPPADTTNVLTALTSNDGTLSLTINVDKSTAVKLGKWVIAALAAFFLMMAAVIFFLGKNFTILDINAREDRLVKQALEDKRLENRAAWKQLGVDGIAMQDHDISDILKQVRKKHPLKEE